MKKNLRIISILMAVVLSLSGCSLNQNSNDNGQINNITPITVDEPSNDIDINEPEEPVLNEVPIESTGELSELFTLARKYYLSVIPGDDKIGESYCDEFPGTFYYSADEGSIHMTYSTTNDDCFVMSLNEVSNTIGIDCMVHYDDNTIFSANSYYLELDSFQAILESIISLDDVQYQIGYDSALANHSDEIPDDIRTLATRMSYMINYTFGSAGIRFENYGFDFSDFVNDDVSKKLPVEPDLSNNHVFENGICTDCGMVWTEVFTENLAAIENVECDEYGDYGFVHYYGQDSEYTYPNAYVQYISAYRYGANMYYIEYGTDSLSNETIIIVSADPETKDSISEIRITFRYMDDYQSQYQGIVTAGFIYDFEVIVNPGEFDKVFASKESLLANCHYSISIYDDEMQSYDYYDNPEDSDDLPNDFMDKFISKEEICDLVNKDYENNLNALNEGMRDINLSLFELGLNYK